MKPIIAIFLHDPECSVDCVAGMRLALESSYEIRTFGLNDFSRELLEDVSVIAFPGGLGEATFFYDHFLGSATEIIQEFVANGGKYLGICMGAYWASSLYLNILDNIEAVQYLKRPDTDTRRPHAKNMSITWCDEPMNMFWYDGCALIGDGDKKVIATYSNGDAMAIIQNRIGLIGCHPESEQFWYDSYSWMNGKYHNGTCLLYTSDAADE